MKSTYVNQPCKSQLIVHFQLFFCTTIGNPAQSPPLSTACRKFRDLVLRFVTLDFNVMSLNIYYCFSYFCATIDSYKKNDKCNHFHIVLPFILQSFIFNLVELSSYCLLESMTPISKLGLMQFCYPFLTLVSESF